MVYIASEKKAMLITYTGLYNSNYTVLIGMMTGEE
jgi:hypothetical protein